MQNKSSETTTAGLELWEAAQERERQKQDPAMSLVEPPGHAGRNPRNPGVRTHGMSRTRFYRRWKSMLDRCLNPNTDHYGDYGGRGIRVCRRWLKFENFLADMGQPSDPRMQLERVNNDSHYMPSNCVWATVKQQ